MGGIVRYEIAAEQEPPVDPPQRNAISVLMAAKELKLHPPPPPKVFATPERYERSSST